ncbi:MAG: NAD-dependent epimerase/dehydratase family protein [Planctomycetota bacterium]
MPAITLVTGASGFVGCHLLPRLVEAGHAVRCLARDPAWSTTHGEVVAGCLGDEASLRRALDGVDVVVHLAALVSFARKDAAESFAVNEAGTRRLAALARAAGVRRFLHVSSVVAIGYSERGEILDETAPYNVARLRVPYCDSKHAAEQAVLDEVERGLDAVIVNPSSMFGPGDRRKARNSLLDAAQRGRVPFAPSGGANFADVRDVAAGCVAALTRGRRGERYILGGENLTGRELMRTVFAAAGRRPPRWSLPRPVTKLLAAGAGVLERVVDLRPPLTAQILRMASAYFWYGSAKAEGELGYRARPVLEAVQAAYRWMEEEGIAGE